ncbi:DUF975 family protein [Streptococcus suis]|uniref:DUF975 family protein n=1 Tax=Streptococcus suis TaxID=1307 RepID=UPI000CF724EF|nr:DUF975 family protein [Streptococcus suis]
MFTISDIRVRARQTLADTPGIYQLAIIPVLISVLVQLISFSGNSATNLSLEELASPSYIVSTSLFPLFYGLLVGLLHLSIMWTIFNLIKGRKKETTFRDSLVIFNLQNFGKMFRTFLLKGVLLFLWGLLFYFGLSLLLGVIIILAAIILTTGLVDPSALPQDVLATLGTLFIVGFILAIIGLFIYIPQYYAYSQAEYILFEQLDRDEYTGAFSIIKSSRQLMKGYKFKRFLLDLSFIGWFILVSITFGLAGLYVWPYHYAAQIHFYEEILDDYASKLNYDY